MCVFSKNAESLNKNREQLPHFPFKLYNNDVNSTVLFQLLLLKNHVKLK
jgi:hypothetical protein